MSAYFPRLQRRKGLPPYAFARLLRLVALPFHQKLAWCSTSTCIEVYQPSALTLRDSTCALYPFSVDHLLGEKVVLRFFLNRPSLVQDGAAS